MENIEEKKEYLKNYERAVRQMERSEEKMKEIHLRQFPSAIRLDGMPHTHNVTDLSGYAVLLEDMEKQYMKDRYLRLKVCKDITDKIECMDDEDEKDVLMFRYVRLMKWENIAEKMNYSWKQVHRIHLRALNNFKVDIE